MHRLSSGKRILEDEVKLATRSAPKAQKELFEPVKEEFKLCYS